MEAFGGEDGIEGVGELGVPVAEQDDSRQMSSCRPAGAFGSGAGPGQMPLVAAQQLAIQVGDVGHAGIAANEVAEALQVGPVAVHGAGGGVPVQFQPRQVLVEGLGQRQGSHPPTVAANFQKSIFYLVRQGWRSDPAVIGQRPVGRADSRSVSRRMRLLGRNGCGDQIQKDQLGRAADEGEQAGRGDAELGARPYCCVVLIVTRQPNFRDAAG